MVKLLEKRLKEKKLSKFPVKENVSSWKKVQL